MTINTDAVWYGWRALLGCRYADCDDQARRFVCLYLNQDLHVIASSSVSEDGKRFGALCEQGRSLLQIVDAVALGALQPHLQDALRGQGWGGAFHRSVAEASIGKRGVFISVCRDLSKRGARVESAPQMHMDLAK